MPGAKYSQTGLAKEEVKTPRPERQYTRVQVKRPQAPKREYPQKVEFQGFGEIAP